MYRSAAIKRTARILSWVCGSLFVIFSVLYLFVMQSDLLVTAQHLLAKGKTAYSPLWGMMVITFILLLLQHIYRKVIAYPLRFQSLYYFPSCLVLGLLTALVPSSGWSVRLAANWPLVAVCVVLYCIITWIVLHFADRKELKHGIFSFLWPNLLGLSALFCMTCSVADTNDVYHYRLKVEKHIVEGNDDEALKVGIQSLSSDRSLTAMRAFLLCRQGVLGDKLFEYPQYYGSEGLMPEPSDTVYVHGWQNLLYEYVGGRPGKKMKGNTVFWEHLNRRKSATAAAHDYLLCAYLLDKNLDAFTSVLPRYYAVNDSLPHYYKEALVLYARRHTSPAIVYKDDAMETNLNDFLHLGTRFADKRERSNQCRRMYGNTYWWYYFYQE